MLHIRKEQLDALTREMYARFDYDAYAHSRRYFPEQCDVLGKEGTLQFVRDGLREARGYGFESQYDLLRYLNLRFTLGEGFDRSEACAWTRPYFEAADQAPIVRMDRLMEEAYKRLYPVAEEPAPEPDEAEALAKEYDGIEWGDTAVPADYVAQSIQPEFVPIVRPPARGSVPAEPMAPDSDEFEKEDEYEEDDYDADLEPVEEADNG